MILLKFYIIYGYCLLVHVRLSVLFFPLFLNLESVVVPIYGTKYLSGICRWEESDQVGDKDFYSELPAF